MKILNEKLDDILFVFALEEEAHPKFQEHNILFCGIGKINATLHLTEYLAKHDKPKLIINLGSAGSNKFNTGEVVYCTQFVQRDMDVSPLGFEKFVTPFTTDSPILNYGKSYPKLSEGICGSGDSFEIAHDNEMYNVIDMEAYALSFVAQKFKIPFLSLKYISDGADESAAESWNKMVFNAGIAFKKILFKKD